MKGNFTENLSLLFKLLIIVLISRLILCFVGYIGMNTFPMYDTIKDKHAQSTLNMDFGITINESRKPRLEDFYKFDSGFYLQISDNGYPKIKMSENNLPTSISFFPLYPLLIRAMHYITNSSSNIFNALLLSNILLVLSLYYIYKLCEIRGFDKKEIYLVILVILSYPTSLFYSVPYTESLFLCLSAATLYYCSLNNYAAASVAAGLSAITRFPGFINIAYVFFVMLLDTNLKFSSIKQLTRIFHYMIISIIPITVYFSYMKYLTGDFLAPLHDVGNWSRKMSIPFKSYIDYIRNPYFFSSGSWNNGVVSFVIATSILAVFVIYIILNRKNMDRKEWIFLLYGFLLIVVPFSNVGSVLVSIPRYLMVSIPIYLYIVEFFRDKKFLFLSYVFLFSTLNTLMVIGYFNGYNFVV
ncbi:hypothetical protein CLHOM_08330 [Clostridium homopropionicum DSM 5847]|uniref:Mannosyltransferase (PIG-V) n=1 Tax=Clostridium homopropionicum DSM 5847 TaxID=1121318 RepID=A0A0L6ZCK3_9CLOT|nr:hypothetical protein [Clostridium homopropionicum]KOA20691.1 hypothetical protein CLHOM_08330 [Clostridium homopropionicum DSM 5847]SFF91375.1 Mannosyltransferase related to Gpi18 [Clostridium homopropionicum]